MKVPNGYSSVKLAQHSRFAGEKNEKTYVFCFCFFFFFFFFFFFGSAFVYGFCPNRNDGARGTRRLGRLCTGHVSDRRAALLVL